MSADRRQLDAQHERRLADVARENRELRTEIERLRRENATLRNAVALPQAIIAEILEGLR